MNSFKLLLPLLLLLSPSSLLCADTSDDENATYEDKLTFLDKQIERVAHISSDVLPCSNASKEALNLLSNPDKDFRCSNNQQEVMQKFAMLLTNFKLNLQDGFNHLSYQYGASTYIPSFPYIRGIKNTLVKYYPVFLRNIGFDCGELTFLRINRVIQEMEKQVEGMDEKTRGAFIHTQLLQEGLISQETKAPETQEEMVLLIEKELENNKDLQQAFWDFGYLQKLGDPEYIKPEDRECLWLTYRASGMEKAQADSGSLMLNNRSYCDALVFAFDN